MEHGAVSPWGLCILLPGKQLRWFTFADCGSLSTQYHIQLYPYHECFLQFGIDHLGPLTACSVHHYEIGSSFSQGGATPLSTTASVVGLAFSLPRLCTSSAYDQPGKNPLKYFATAGNWAPPTGSTDSEIHSFSHWAVVTNYIGIHYTYILYIIYAYYI